MSRLAATVALAVFVVPAAATSQQHGSADAALARAAWIDRDARAASARAAKAPLADTRAQRRRLQLMAGDMLSASSIRNRAVQVTASGDKVVSARLSGQDFVPRGVDYDPGLGLMAIAAVSQVLLLDPATGDVTAVAGPEGGAFEFANDVVFDGVGGLVIADQGAETNDREPIDGAVWRYDLVTAELVEIALKRQLANPKLLARGRNGLIHVIDGGAGMLVSPSFAARWDVLYRLEGKKFNNVKVVWGGAGIQATAYDLDSAGWHWIVNVGELVRVKGEKLLRPCLPPYPLQFATGLTIDESGSAMVLDGADVLTKQRALYAIDNMCEVTLSTDRKLKGSRGLTHVAAE